MPVVVDGIVPLVQGKKITRELIDQVGARARKAARPVANAATSPGYRRDMAAELTRRCIEEAARRTGVLN